jgi:hypothetical protein
VRFSITGDSRMVYVIEKDHAPVAHGVMEFPGSQTANTLLEHQARAFIESRHRQIVRVQAAG